MIRYHSDNPHQPPIQTKTCQGGRTLPHCTRTGLADKTFLQRALFSIFGYVTKPTGPGSITFASRFSQERHSVGGVDLGRKEEKEGFRINQRFAFRPTCSGRFLFLKATQTPKPGLDVKDPPARADPSSKRQVSSSHLELTRPITCQGPGLTKASRGFWAPTWNPRKRAKSFRITISTVTAILVGRKWYSLRPRGFASAIAPTKAKAPPTPSYHLGIYLQRFQQPRT